MKPFEQLLAEAQQIVKEISQHESFAEIYAQQLLDNTDVSICSAWTCFDNLSQAHQKITGIPQKSSTSSLEIKEAKMQNLTKVYDATLLTRSAIYQVDGISYRYFGKDPYSSINSPKYTFKPLPGQRKQSDLVLSQKQLMVRCYEVQGMHLKECPTPTESIQLALF